MMTTISSGSATLFGLAGYAPASPQSARGESVSVEGLQTEMVAVSQANSSLYDQRANLNDTQVPARVSALEFAARSGNLSRQTDFSTQASSPDRGHLPQPGAELAPFQRVQRDEKTSPQQRDPQSKSRQKALQAYSTPQTSTASTGQSISTKI